MTATQSLKIYELLNKHFRNEEDAKQLVSDIETVVEEHFLAERDRLATKTDLLAVKEDLAKMETRIILWIVSFNTVLAGIIIAAFKLL